MYSTVNVLEQYVLSNPYGMVHFFVLPRGEHQLCRLLAALCGLAEQVYQKGRVPKGIVSVMYSIQKVLNFFIF